MNVILLEMCNFSQNCVDIETNALTAHTKDYIDRLGAEIFNNESQASVQSCSKRKTRTAGNGTPKSISDAVRPSSKNAMHTYIIHYTRHLISYSCIV